MRGQAIERVYEHIAAARVAATKLGETVAQTAVFALHDLERHIGYCHDSTSASRMAVKVDPVVPVKRTLTYVPIQSVGPSSSAILFVRVRACNNPPRLAGPSTRTPCAVPPSARARRRRALRPSRQVRAA